jgi:hypothetical protein
MPALSIFDADPQLVVGSGGVNKGENVEQARSHTEFHDSACCLRKASETGEAVGVLGSSRECQINSFVDLKSAIFLLLSFPSRFLAATIKEKRTKRLPCQGCRRLKVRRVSR